ncbi:type IV pilus twitching motility protein PilT [Zophobihabitans entericus]|uniref:PilT/PilU family type 4a pilus ATPase n=1 Tax=Zophobihabitans entericus TaxID=1635327 RepID=A0A6G9IBX1_9GAMM|nr:PilT/PilU family type 4a pilus ATPase [Zophobihabitans entericus]QIQ21332.1 PilT/PilU family type 4a pilus ATPase [Zophobihabitans entericus]
MESIFAISLAQNASDLHLSSGQRPAIRVNGQLIHLELSVLQPDILEQQLYQLLSEPQLQQLKIDRQIDFAYHHEQYGRFRGNIFYQKNGISASFRLIKQTIPTLNKLGAPTIFTELIEKQQGLILITGATGSGKSTTLAALIQHINQSKAKHIITLEDPIEFIYPAGKALIQQREVNLHIYGFESALKSLLRQDPDIILLGELRNQQTIQAALTAAETGHLVLATLHTNSAIQSINRIVDVFPGEMKYFVKAQLADCLCAVINQTLVMNTQNTGRFAAYEVLINTPAVSHLIKEGKNSQILSLLQTGQQYGMQTMEQGIRKGLQQNQ